MAKQDDKTIGEILDDMEFREKVFKYAKIGAFAGTMGLLIYLKGYANGYTLGCSYGYTFAVSEIKHAFPEIFEGLLKATMTVK